MIRRLLIVAILLASASISWAEDARLLPLDGQAYSYSRAALMIPDADFAAGTRAVRFRDALGGPTWIIPVMPATTGGLYAELALPALRSHQDYVVETLAAPTADAPALDTFTLSIIWPTSQVNATEFINPAFAAPFDVRQPTWSTRTKLTLLLGALIVTIVAAGLLWVRRPLFRLAALLVLVGSATYGAVSYLARQPAVIVRPASQSDATVLTARRSDVYHLDKPCMPIYLNVSGWIEDRSVISPDGIDVPISPGEVKLTRPLPNDDTD